MITNATYAGSSLTVVFIEPDNKNVSAYDPELLEWVSSGNTIDPYIELMGDNKEVKYDEIYTYADNLIAEEEDTFFVKGKGKGRNKDRLVRQQNKRNNKKIKGQTLNPKEQDEEDRYDSFMTWTGDVYDEADKSRDKVENYPHVEQVKNYDVINDPNWPVWNYS